MSTTPSIHLHRSREKYRSDLQQESSKAGNGRTKRKRSGDSTAGEDRPLASRRRRRGAGGVAAGEGEVGARETGGVAGVDDDGAVAEEGGDAGLGGGEELKVAEARTCVSVLNGEREEG